MCLYYLKTKYIKFNSNTSFEVNVLRYLVVKKLTAIKIKSRFMYSKQTEKENFTLKLVKACHSAEGLSARLLWSWTRASSPFLWEALGIGYLNSSHVS